ncbi:hypothetical protein F5I97DRAFT_642001 [Phlebopus sp. FC_14]|nr:hypothetical protein F5I97DRAFT_642001 [Phlebopus sp. FC_14]
MGSLSFVAILADTHEASLGLGGGKPRPVQRSGSGADGDGDGAGGQPVRASTPSQGVNAGEKRPAQEHGEHADAPKPKRVKSEVEESSSSGVRGAGLSGSPQEVVQQPTNSSDSAGQGDDSRTGNGDNVTQPDPSTTLPPANDAVRGTPPSTPPPPKASPHKRPASGNQMLAQAKDTEVLPQIQSPLRTDACAPLTTEDENQITKDALPTPAVVHLQEFTNVVHTKTPSAFDLPPLPKRSDTLVLLSSPHRPSSPINQPPNRQRRFRERPRAQSDLFASLPPSPQAVPANENVPSPSQRTDVGLASTNGSTRAPPRVVETFFGPALVDQKGKVPRRPLRDSDEESSEGKLVRDIKEEHEEEERWPPVRSHAATAEKVEGKGKEKEKAEHDHHAFSQLVPEKWPTSSGRRSHHPFGQVNQVRPHAQIQVDAGEERLGRGDMDRRAAADQFLGRKSDGLTKEKSTEPEVVATANVSRLPEQEVVALPPPPPPPQPKQASRESKFPAPRASTRSPFRLPEPPQRPSTSRTVHPALARIRRQTFGGHGHRGVPSIDLAAMSASALLSASTSRRSSTSASTTRSRRSLPAHLMRPLFSDRAAHSLVWPDVRYPSHVQSPSLTSHDRANVHTSPSTNLTPHPADISLVQLYGLDYALNRMSANHGLALSVVQAVYERVDSLPEADAILRGMREAAENWGEAEISRLHSEVKGDGDDARGDRETPLLAARRKSRRRSDENAPLLKYVPASEDGERSEYSPPETTRAARWKRESMLGQSVDDVPDEGVPGRQEGVEGESDEEEEDRVVDRELSYEDREEELELEDVGGDTHHEFSQHVARRQVPAEPDGNDDTDDRWRRALQVNQEALQLERKVGKQEYRRHIANMFK